VKIATYNVNGVNGRLSNLLSWLKQASPDVVCLQELKAPEEKFPAAPLRAAGYGAIWHGQKSWNGVAILARGAEPVETRRGLPGDPDDMHSRYIEATVHGLVVGCLYLPTFTPFPILRKLSMPRCNNLRMLLFDFNQICLPFELRRGIRARGCCCRECAQ
jgi:exodeoxyribonuclease-3